MWVGAGKPGNEKMTPGMARGFQMAGRGMRQSSYFPEAPEVFSKFSDGLDHQATRFTDLPSPGLICMLASWKKRRGPDFVTPSSH